MSERFFAHIEQIRAKKGHSSIIETVEEALVYLARKHGVSVSFPDEEELKHYREITETLENDTVTSIRGARGRKNAETQGRRYIEVEIILHKGDDWISRLKNSLPENSQRNYILHAIIEFGEA